jgi:serine/threonine-protein kinase HipA
MIKVWADGRPTGVLDRFGARGSTFAYDPLAPSDAAISVTMAVRVPSWNDPLGVLPIFEMNLPEGALRERLRLAFAKGLGSFDDVDLLGIVGRSQLGRLRYSGMGEDLDRAVPFQSIDEIISSRRGGEYYRYLLDRFAQFSGVSGVQPKILVRDQTSFRDNHGSFLHDSFRGATHIVKFWDQEYSQLAANEFFCLQAAQASGLHVPTHQLTEDASALIVARFDLRPDGTYRGFEDFCVLNARRTDQKYRGSYETAIVKRFGQACGALDQDELTRLFKLIVLNCTVRNGDAHLKNFGVVYDDVLGVVSLAPVYDIVTTTAYIVSDRMALTLNGSTDWPSAKQLMHFGETRILSSQREVKAVFEQVAQALSETIPAMRTYISHHPDFAIVGERMIGQWAEGIRSLQL